MALLQRPGLVQAGLPSRSSLLSGRLHANPRSWRALVRATERSGSYLLEAFVQWAKPTPEPMEGGHASEQLQELQSAYELVREAGAITWCMTIIVKFWSLIMLQVNHMPGVHVNPTDPLFMDTATRLVSGAWVSWFAMYTSFNWHFKFKEAFYAGCIVLGGLMLPLAYYCALQPSAVDVARASVPESMMLVSMVAALVVGGLMQLDYSIRVEWLKDWMKWHAEQEQRTKVK